MGVKNLTGFIAAGGQGSRMRPLTDVTPKPLLMMGRSNRQLIDTALDILCANCEQVFVSTHYQAKALQAKLHRYPNVQILYEEQPLGSAGAFIRHYQRFLQLDPDGSTLIIPADTVLEGLDFEAFHRAHLNYETDVTLATIPPKSYGVYIHTADGKAKGYARREEPGARNIIPIYLIRNRYLLRWAKIMPAIPQDITRDLIGPTISEQIAAVLPLPDSVYWDDAGTLERYHANNMRLSGETNVIAPNVHIGAGSELKRCVVLEGVTLGTDLRIENAILSPHPLQVQITRL